MWWQLPRRQPQDEWTLVTLELKFKVWVHWVWT